MNLNKNFNSSTNILKVIFTGVTILAKPTQAHVLLIELMLKEVVMRRLKTKKNNIGAKELVKFFSLIALPLPTK